MPLDVYCRPCAQAGKYHSNPNQVHTLWCILCSCAKLTNIACLPSATYDATQAHVHLWNATAAVNIICQARHNFGDDYPLFGGLACGGVLNRSCLHALCKHGDGGADAMTHERQQCKGLGHSLVRCIASTNPCRFQLTVQEGVKVRNTIGGHVVEVVELGLRGPADPLLPLPLYGTFSEESIFCLGTVLLGPG